MFVKINKLIIIIKLIETTKFKIVFNNDVSRPNLYLNLQRIYFPRINCFKFVYNFSKLVTRLCFCIYFLLKKAFIKWKIYIGQYVCIE